MPNQDLINSTILELNKSNQILDLNSIETPSNAVAPIKTYDSNLGQYSKGFIPRSLSDDNEGLLELHKANTQSNWDKFGNMLVRGVAKAGISVVEPIGHLLDIEQMVSDVNETEANYGNWFNQMLVDIQENLDEALPIYTKDDKPGLLGRDWWFKNGDQIIKSIGYIVPAGAMSKGSSLLLKGLTKAIGTTGVKIGSALVPGIAMNYSEHMLSAAQAFDENKAAYYKQNIDSGKFNTVEEAEMDARFRASTDAEGIIAGGKINILFNTLEYMNLFKVAGSTRRFTNATRKEVATTILGTSLAEYAEEVTTGFFEQEAKRKMLIETGQIEDDGSSHADRYITHLSSYEGLTEGISGALGGGGMQIISNLLGSKDIQIGKKTASTTLNFLSDSKNIEKVQDVEFFKKLYDNAQAGTFKSVEDGLNTIIDMNPEDIAKYELKDDTKARAIELKEMALAFEKDYNELSTTYQDNPVLANAMINAKTNERYARKKVLEEEAKLKDLKANYTEDEKSHPYFKIKELRLKEAAINQELANNFNPDAKVGDRGLLEQLDENDPTSRTITTNESEQEVLARSELLINKRNTVQEEINNQRQTIINAKTKGIEVESEKKIITNDVTKDINEYLVNETQVDKDVMLSTQIQQTYQSQVENSSKLISDVTNDPNKLATYKKVIEEDRKNIVATDLKEFTDELDKTNLNTIEELKGKANTKQKDKLYKARFKKLRAEQKERGVKAKRTDIAKDDSPSTPLDTPKEGKAPLGSKEDAYLVFPIGEVDQTSTVVNETSSEDKITSARIVKQFSNKDTVEQAIDDFLDNFKTKDVGFDANSITGNITVLEGNTILNALKTRKPFKPSMITNAESIILSRAIVEVETAIELAKFQEDLHGKTKDNIKASKAIEQPDGYTPTVDDSKIDDISYELNTVETKDGNAESDPILNKVVSIDALTVEGARALAYLSMDYVAVNVPDGEGGYITKKYTISNTRNKKLLTDIETNKVKIGTKVRFKIDTEYVLTDEDGNEIDSYNAIKEKYKNDIDGFIQEVPIRIELEIDGIWKSGPYLHRTEWIGFEDNNGDIIANNVAPEYEEEDNARIQYEKSVDTRKKVYAILTDGGDVTGVIDSKGLGYIPKNLKKDSEGNVKFLKNKIKIKVGEDIRTIPAGKPIEEKRTVKELLPGIAEDGRFAITVHGEVLTSKGNAVDFKPINKSILSKTDGVVWAIIPTPSNKQSIVPMISPTISAITTSVGSSDIYGSLQNLVDVFYSDAPLDAINAKAKTNLLDRANGDGIRSILDQYLFMKRDDLGKSIKGKFDISVTKEGKLLIVDHFNQYTYGILNKNGKVSIARQGKVTKNNKPEAESISKEDFLAKFDEALKNSRFSTKLTRINESGSVYDYIFKYKGKNIVLQETIKHNSYNEFISTKLQTRYNGTNKAADGSYLYFSQPVTTFKIDGIDDAPNTTNRNETEKIPIVDKDIKVDNNIEIDLTIPNKDISKAVAEPITPIDSNISKAPIILDDKTDADYISAITKDLYIAEFSSYKDQDDITNNIIKLIYDGFISTGDLKTTSELISDVKYTIIQHRDRITAIYNKVNTDGGNSLEIEDRLYLLNTGMKGSLSELVTILNNLNVALDDANWIKLAYSSLNILNSKGITDDTATLVDNAEDSQYERVKFDSKSRLMVSPFASVSTKFKLFLDSIPNVIYKNGERIEVKNKFGLPVLLDGDFVASRISTIMVDKAKTLDELLRILDEEGINNPIFKTIKLELENPKNRSIATQMVNSMCKHRSELTRVIKDKGKASYKILNNNNKTGSISIINEWKGVQKISNITKGNKYNINKEYIKSIKDDYNVLLTNTKNVQGEAFTDELAIVLTKLGFPVSKKVTKELSKSYTLARWRNQLNLITAKGYKANGLMGSIFSNYEKVQAKTVDSTTSDYEYANVLFKPNPSIFELAELVFNDEGRIYDTIALDSENNLIYEMSNYTMLDSSINNIKDNNTGVLEGRVKTLFGRHSILGKDMLNNETYRSNFGVTYMDAYGEFGNRYYNERKDLTPSTTALLPFILFQNAGSDYGKYLTPTLGDNSTSPIIKFHKKKIDVIFEDGKIVDLDNTTKDLLYELAANEIDRIVWFNENNPTSKLDDYLEGADKFILFNYLNQSEIGKYVKDGTITQDEANNLYVNGKLTILDDTINTIKKIMTKHTIDNIFSSIEYLKGVDIINTNKNDVDFSNEFDVTYMKGLENKVNKTYFAVADFYINDLISTVEQYILIYGDPALYSDAKGGKFSISKTYKNIEKRLKGIISPHETGNFNDENFTIATAKDRIIDSQFNKTYNEQLGFNGYDAINTTDAGEYTTVEEDLNVKLAFDIIDIKIYNSIMDKINKAGKGGYYTLSGIELKVVLNPVKPIIFTSIYNDELQTNEVVFRKSGAYSLLPQLTKGQEIDRVRIAMEKQGVARLGNESSDKLGKSDITEIFDDKGKVLKDIKFVTKTISRADFGLQQRTPHGKTEVHIITQMNKLLFNNIRNVKFDNNKTGKDLELEKEAIRVELFDIGLDRVKNLFGITIDANNQFVINDLSKIQSTLIREAEDRNWNKLDIRLLELLDDNSDFRFPLLFNNSYDKIQSLLLSVIKKEVIDTKFNGKGNIQVSGAGYKPIDKILYSKLSSKEQVSASKNIVYTPEFNIDLGLQHTRKVDENGKASLEGTVKPSQVLIPWDFRDQTGRLLDINNYMKDGVINFDMIPRELLQIIAARIPNQSHSSMMPVEIVGFLPSSMNTMIVVADEMIAQTGSDFDIDKLYSYMKYHNAEILDLYIDEIQDIKADIKTLHEETNSKDAKSFIEIIDTLKESKVEYNKRFNIADLKPTLISILETGTEVRHYSKSAVREATLYLDTLDVEDIIKINSSRYSNLKEFTKEENIINASLIKSAITKFNQGAKNALEINEFQNALDAIIDNNAERKDLVTKLKELKKLSAQPITIDNSTRENELKNRYIDIHWEILTNGEVYNHMIRPLSKDDIKLEFEKLSSKTTPNILDWRYRNDTYRAQSDGKTLVGASSVYNILNSTLQPHNIKLRVIDRSDANNPKWIDKTITFRLDDDSYLELDRISGEGVSYYGDKTKANKRLKSDNIVLIQDASVDNPSWLGNLNINPNTINIAMTILMLQDKIDNAVAIDQVTTLLTQPAILKFNELYNIQKGKTPYLSKADIFDLAIGDTMTYYENKISKLTGKPFEGITAVIESPREMLEARAMLNSDRYLVSQLSSLLRYSELNEISNDINTLSTNTLFATRKGAGKTIFDSRHLVDDFIHLSKTGGLSNIIPLLGEPIKDNDGIVYDIDLKTEDGIAIENSAQFANTVVGDLMSINNSFVSMVMGLHRQAIQGEKLSVKHQNEAVRELRKFMLSGNNALFDVADVDLERQRLLFDIKDNKSLGTRIEDYKAKYSNKFLEFVTVSRLDDKTKRVAILYNRTDKNINVLENTQAITDLLSSKDEDVRKLGEDIVKYAYLSGGVFDPVSYVKFTNTEYLKHIGFDVALRNTNLNTNGNYELNKLYAKRYYKQFVQHNPRKAVNSAIYGAKFKVDLSKTIGRATKVFEVSIPHDEKVNPPQFIYRGKKKLRLFELVGLDKDRVVYHAIDTLGNAGRSNTDGNYVVEYNIHKDNSRSIIKSNNVIILQSTRVIVPLDYTVGNTNIKVDTTVQLPTDSNYGSLIPQYFTSNKLRHVLDNVTNNKAHEILANILQTSQVRNKINTLIIVDELAKDTAALYNPTENVITINKKSNRTVKQRQNALEQLILHEGIHSVLDKYINGDAKMNPAQQAIYNNVEKLYSELHRRFKANPKTSKLITEAKKAATYDPNEDTSLTKENYPYYPMANIKEFFTGVMTNKEFQKVINEEEYIANKSFLAKTIELITKFIEELGKLANIDFKIKKNSALEVGIHDILNLLMVDENDNVTFIQSDELTNEFNEETKDEEEVKDEETTPTEENEVDDYQEFDDKEEDTEGNEKGKTTTSVVKSKPVNVEEQLSMFSEDKVTISTKAFTETTVADKTKAFVFTDNLQAYLASRNRLAEVASLPRQNEPIKVGVTSVNNQAGIRTIGRGKVFNGIFDDGVTLNDNAFSVITKKFQQKDKSDAFVSSIGFFTDSVTDFELFKEYNTEAIDAAIEDGRPITFPSAIANSKSALPKRFAQWLNKTMYDKLGIRGTITNTAVGEYGIINIKVEDARKISPSKEVNDQYDLFNEPEHSPSFKPNVPEDIISLLKEHGIIHSYKDVLYVTRNDSAGTRGNKFKTHLDINLHRIARFNLNVAKGLEVVHTYRETEDRLGHKVIIDQANLDELNRINRAKVIKNGSPMAQSNSPVSTDQDVKLQRLEWAISNRINDLSKKIIRTEHDKLKVDKFIIQKYKEQIAQLRIDLAALREDNSANSLLDISAKQLNYVNRLINQDDISATELRLAMNITDMWSNKNMVNYLTDEQIGNTTSDYNRAIKEIGAESSEISNRLLQRAREFVLSDIQRRINPNAVIEDISYMDAIGWFAGMTLDSSKVGNDFIKTISSHIKKVERNAVGLISHYDDKIVELFSIFNNPTLANIVGKDYNLFWEQDKDGNYTGGMINELSATWNQVAADIRGRWVNLNGKVTGGKLTNKQKAIARKIIRDEKANTINIDILMLLDSNNKRTAKGYEFNSKEEYVAYLNEELGESLASNYIKEALANYAEYQEELKQQTAVINENEDIIDKEEAINNWSLEHSPITVLNEMYGDALPDLDISKLTGRKYITKVPRRRRKIKGGYEETGYYNPKFKQVLDNTPLHDFYIKHNVIMRELLTMMPDYIMKDSLPNFLANVQKHQLIDFKNGLYNGLDAAIKDAITTDQVVKLKEEEDSRFVNRDEYTGRIKNEIPTSYINPLQDNYNRSFDLESNLKMFSKMAIGYAYRNAVEDTVLLMQRVLQDTKETPKNEGGKNIFDRTKTLIGYSDGLKIANELIGHDILSHIYGKTKEDTGSINYTMYSNNPIASLKNVGALNEKRKRASEIKTRANIINEALDLNKDSNELTNKQVKALEEELEALTSEFEKLGGKNLSLVKLGDKLMKWTQLKGLGLNATAGLSNILFGLISNFTHGNGRVDFNNKELGRAFRLVLKSKTQAKGVNKIFNIVKRFDVLFDVIDTRYGEVSNKSVLSSSSSKFKKFISTRGIDIFMFQTKGEYLVQSMSFIAHLMHTKIDAKYMKSGESITAFDLYDEYGKVREDLLTDDGKLEYTNIVGPDEDNKHTELRNKGIQLNKMLHGNYDPASGQLAKRYFLGRALLQFRTWLPEGVASRFQNTYKDEQLGREIKGRWVTYYDLGLGTSVKTLVKQILHMNNTFVNNGKQMNDLDVENMRRNLAELLIYSSLVTAATMFKYMLDGDDDDNEMAGPMRLIMNSVFRAQQDIYMYISPQTFYNILHDPVPLTKSITDLGKAIDASWRYASDSTYQGNLVNRWLSVAPLTTQVPKLGYLYNNYIGD